LMFLLPHLIGDWARYGVKMSKRCQMGRSVSSYVQCGGARISGCEVREWRSLHGLRQALEPSVLHCERMQATRHLNLPLQVLGAECPLSAYLLPRSPYRYDVLQMSRVARLAMGAFPSQCSVIV
jgi:hypothetical protein